MVNLNHYPALLSRSLEIATPVITDPAELAKAKEDAKRLGVYCEENKYVRVPFVGDFSAGKSTLLNTFLGEDVLPTNILPETAVSYELFYAPEPKLEHYRGGSLLGTTALNAIKSLNTLPGDIVRVYMPNDKLLALQSRGIILVDMPGIDSGIQEHQDAINNYLEHGSHFVMLLDAEQGSLRSSTISFMNELVQYKIALSVLISKCDKKPAEDVEQIRALVENQCRLTLSQEVTVGTCSSVLNSFASLEQVLSSVDVEGAIRKKLEAPCYGYINGLVSGLTSRASVLMTNTSDLDAKLAQLEADKAAASAELQERLSAQQGLVTSVDDVLADVRQALDNKAQHLATVCFQNKGNQDVIQSEFISVIRPAVVNSVQSETEEYQATLGSVLQGFTAKGSSTFSIDKVLGDLLPGVPLEKLLIVQLTKLSAKLLARGGKYVMMLGKGLAFLATGPVVGLILGFLPDVLGWLFGSSDAKKIDKLKGQLQAEVFPKVVEELRPVLNEMLADMRAESTAAAEQAIAEQAQQYEQAIARLRAEEERSVAEREAEAKRLLEVVAELRRLIA